MLARRLPVFVIAALVAMPGTAAAQERKPTPKETAAIRACIKKNETDTFDAERKCVFNLVATPCTNRPKNQSSQGQRDCYEIEFAIWEVLVKENLKKLREELDAEQMVKLDNMQNAWSNYRETTCNFYYDKIQGSMATSMIAACMARESARRALLLAFFQGL